MLNLHDLKHVRGVSSVKGCVVQEQEANGRTVERVVAMEDVPKGEVVKEVIIVDDSMEKEIRKSLREYKWTARYIAVVMTILLLKVLYDNVLHGFFPLG